MTTTDFRLYCFAQSGNAFKAALMLELCGAKWTPRFVDFFGGETRTPGYRAINEMGEVPVLEHGAIRILWDNHKFTSYIATLRYMVTLAKIGEPQVHDFLRGRVKSALGILELHLSKCAFAVGDTPTIADFSLCGYLYWPDEFGVSWSDYPRIAAWLGRIQSLPGWAHPYELMPGHPLKR